MHGVNGQAPLQHPHSNSSNKTGDEETTQTPEVMPTLAALIVALALALSRWLQWVFDTATPLLTSPRFTGAVKEAGLVALPVVQTVVSEVWKWYTAVEHDKRLIAAASAGQITGLPCNTSQTLTIGVNMPGVSVNVQYTSSNTPAISQQQQQQQGSYAGSTTATLENRLPLDSHSPLKALPAPEALAEPAAVEESAEPGRHSLFGRAYDSVTAVSSLPIQTLAIIPLYAPLHPLKFASNVWNASRPRRTVSV